ncbi:MAG: hypothetical protein H3C62_15820 [Gemmatimonadaceae bacterium]|nr:hypothetical protein [Gemmatimonadaceae bacterium]
MQHRHLLPNEIDLLLDGDAGFGAAPLRAHVDDCADCRTRLDEARVVADALERLPHFAPRAGFADRVLTQVHIVEPWHVAALGTARRFVPESRPLRALALAGAGVASVAISAGAVWIAWSANLTVGSASVVAGRARDLVVSALQDGLVAVFGAGAAEAVRTNGAMAVAAGAVALIAAVGAAALGFRALATASRQRGS